MEDFSGVGESTVEGLAIDNGEAKGRLCVEIGTAIGISDGSDGRIIGDFTGCCNLAEERIIFLDDDDDDMVE